MRRTRLALVLVLLTILVPVLGARVRAAAKPSDAFPPGKNPHLGNKASIKSGMALYRVRCGDCHGLDASGYRGPDLNAVLAAMPDERLFSTIRKGVPGTEMPPSTAPDDEVLMLIAYLRNMGARRAGGNADRQRRERREAVRLAVRELPPRRWPRRPPRPGSVAGGRRPIARGACRAKSARRPTGCRPATRAVTLVTKDGQKIRGVKKNEDVFSIQVMDTRERIQGYLKSSLRT